MNNVSEMMLEFFRLKNLGGRFYDEAKYYPDKYSGFNFSIFDEHVYLGHVSYFIRFSRYSNCFFVSRSVISTVAGRRKLEKSKEEFLTYVLKNVDEELKWLLLCHIDLFSEEK